MMHVVERVESFETLIHLWFGLQFAINYRKLWKANGNSEFASLEGIGMVKTICGKKLFDLACFFVSAAQMKVLGMII